MKVALKIVLSLVAILSVGGAMRSYAQEPIFDGRFSKDSVEIGEQVEYLLDIEVDRATEIGIPFFGEVTTEAQRQQIRGSISTYKQYDEDALELLKDYPIDTIKQDGRTLHLRKRYRFAAMQTGSLSIRPSILYYPKNSSVADTIYTDDIALYVRGYEDIDTMTVMTANGVDVMAVNQRLQTGGLVDLRDMPFIDEEVQQSEDAKSEGDNMILYIILASILVLGIIVYFVWRKLRKRKESEVILPPHVEANKALAELNNRKLWQGGKYNQYYTILTHILRRYISRRWNVRAMEYTTNETMAALQSIDMPDKCRADIATILRTADMAKFAKAEPDNMLNEECYTKAYYFVENTKPVEVESDDKREISSETKIGE
jgi:hypothetical protein